MVEKICTKCNFLLEVNKFSPNKKYKDGFNYWCKKCCNEYRKIKGRKKRIVSPETNKKNYYKHKEKRLLSFKQYYQNNKDKIKQQQKLYRQDNKKYIYLKNRKRKKLLSGSNISPQEIKSLIKKFNNCCYYCGSDQKIEIDHIFPLSKGGDHYISNLVPACKACNLAKKDKLPQEWFKIILPKKENN
jgi:5-methylcytosine-specific restriction endonuclease McrA